MWREWARRYESHGTWSARDTHAKRRRRELKQANTARNANTRYARQNALAQSPSNLIARTQDAESIRDSPLWGTSHILPRLFPSSSSSSSSLLPFRSVYTSLLPLLLHCPIIRLPALHPPILITRLSRPRASLNTLGDTLLTGTRSNKIARIIDENAKLYMYISWIPVTRFLGINVFLSLSLFFP